MIDNNLRIRVGEAFLEGRYEEALILSQQLDIQINKATKEMMNSDKKLIEKIKDGSLNKWRELLNMFYQF